jgi:hypothetical protein
MQQLRHTKNIWPNSSKPALHNQEFKRIVFSPLPANSTWLYFCTRVNINIFPKGTPIGENLASCQNNLMVIEP